MFTSSHEFGVYKNIDYYFDVKVSTPILSMGLLVQFSFASTTTLIGRNGDVIILIKQSTYRTCGHHYVVQTPWWYVARVVYKEG
jgi:hypothetical protein